MYTRTAYGVFIVLFIIYIVFIIVAMKQDNIKIVKLNTQLSLLELEQKKLDNSENSIEFNKCKDNIEVVQKDINNTKQSKLKKMLVTSRDGAIRGALMGCITNGSVAAFDGAVLWLLISGIMNGISDSIQWNTDIIESN